MEKEPIVEEDTPERCPYCNQMGYYKRPFAFKCVKCGTKAIQGDMWHWYYEKHHLVQFEELKKRLNLGDWFEGDKNGNH